MSKEELKQRLDDTGSPPPLILDVRLKYPYEHSTVTLPGAIRMLPGALDVTVLPRDRDLVLFDSDPGEIVSARAAAELNLQGFRAFALQGGIAEWMGAKLPTDSKPAPQPAAPATSSAKA